MTIQLQKYYQTKFSIRVSRRPIVYAVWNRAWPWAPLSQ